MATNLVIPSLGLTMESGTIVEWLKQEGEQVEKDDPVLMIDTDKATADVAAPASGILGSIIAKVGDVIPVGNKVAVIYTADEYSALKSGPVHMDRPTETTMSPAPAQEQTYSVSTVSIARKTEDPIFASPAAKKLAQELQVELSEVTGSGPNGRILESNVAAYGEKRIVKPSISNNSSVISLTGMRKTIAKRMVASHQTTAPVTIFMEVQMNEVVRVRAQMNAGTWLKGVKMSYDAIFAKAAAIALQQHPGIQAQWSEEGLIHPEGSHIGIAVALPDGLVVPVVKNADQRSLYSIAKEIGRLAATAKQGSLSPNAMSGGTFTITNLGMYPISGFTPVINLPEAAILGIGAIKQAAIVEEGKIVIGQTAELSLTFDHRLIDGAPAAAFLAQIKSLIEQPYQLMIEED
jgi:pyruvate dehydrogenase E2 component (dihydrolipoamide acetyltransferase)